jgi:hypothetical protein
MHNHGQYGPRGFGLDLAIFCDSLNLGQWEMIFRTLSLCKESLNSDGQQFYLYQQNEQSSLTFSPGHLVPSTNKTERHDITEILLKVALNTIKQKIQTKPYLDTLSERVKYIRPLAGQWESLNSDGQQFYLYQQNEQSSLT